MKLIRRKQDISRNGYDKKSQQNDKLNEGTVRKVHLIPGRNTRDTSLSDARKLYPGGCKAETCGLDAACIPLKNDTEHYCLCPNNGEQPTENFECPRNTVPLTPKAIRNVIPPSSSSNFSDFSVSPIASIFHSLPNDIASHRSSSSNPKPLQTASPSGASGSLMLALGGVLFLFLIAVPLVIWYFKRRNCLVNGKTKPRIRPGEPLLAERYITNPQYGVYTVGTTAVSSDDSEVLQVPLLHRSALTILEEVGEGCFGKVHKGLLRISNEEQVVAIKVLKESAGRSAEEDFIREVSIMSAFRHPNILKLIGVVYRDELQQSPSMVFEYMEWGDLAGVLRGSRRGVGGPALSEPDLLTVALAVARGMHYLASRRFVHRDLAARNCLVGAQLAVKIADFGMSRDVYTSDYYRMGGNRPMPVRWMSPESIMYARFTHESDVWSYGVVLWEIYSRGKQPFYGHNNDSATNLILRGTVLVPPEDCPRFACDIMRACWKSEPEERVTFEEICEKLEAATNSEEVHEVRLPRPPPLLDAEGYLKPTPLTVTADYVVPLESDTESDSSEEDEEYT